MDSDLELPTSFNSLVNSQPFHSPQQSLPNYKRPTKPSLCPNLKRAKSDSLPPKSLKLEPEKPTSIACNEESEEEAHRKLEKVDLDETKEQLKLLLENNFTNSTTGPDGNLSDHGECFSVIWHVWWWVASCFVVFIVKSCFCDFGV